MSTTLSQLFLFQSGHNLSTRSYRFLAETLEVALLIVLVKNLPKEKTIPEELACKVIDSSR